MYRIIYNWQANIYVYIYNDPAVSGRFCMNVHNKFLLIVSWFMPTCSHLIVVLHGMLYMMYVLIISITSKGICVGSTSNNCNNVVVNFKSSSWCSCQEANMLLYSTLSSTKIPVNMQWRICSIYKDFAVTIIQLPTMTITVIKDLHKQSPYY